MPSKGSKAERRNGAVIFPRFHQWDAVLQARGRRARATGPGQNYLVQHSAGSGKSNTIAWLAHRLSTPARRGRREGVRQGRRDHRPGGARPPVAGHDLPVRARPRRGREDRQGLRSSSPTRWRASRRGSSSRRCRSSRSCSTRSTSCRQRRYAVIVDEAHSSQTGEAAKDLKRVLGGARARSALAAAEAADAAAEEARGDGEDVLARRRSARGPAGEPVLLRVHRDAEGARRWSCSARATRPTDRYEPFHLYSMRQAIEEGFILDVLANYTTYETYFRHREGDRATTRSTRRRRRSAAIARFVTLHPHNLAQKAEVIVEHFRAAHRRRRSAARPRRWSSRSRLHAVRYKQALDRYITRARATTDVHALVAFSGTVIDDGDEFTEPSMNGFPESQTAQRVRRRRVPGAGRRREVPDRLRPAAAAHHVRRQAARRAERRADAVAAQPHPPRARPTRSSSTSATTPRTSRRRSSRTTTRPSPSRPTRTCSTTPATTSTRSTCCATRRSRTPLACSHRSGTSETTRKLYALLDPAVERFNALDEDDQDEFRDALNRFVALYAFLSQIVSFTDTDLERDYLYCRALGTSCSRTAAKAGSTSAREVELTHLRLEQTFEGSVVARPRRGRGAHDLRRPRPTARTRGRAPLPDHRRHQRAVRPQPHRRRPTALRPVRAELGRRPDPRRPGASRTTSTTSASRSTASSWTPSSPAWTPTTRSSSAILDDSDFRDLLADFYVRRSTSSYVPRRRGEAARVMRRLPWARSYPSESRSRK